MDSAPRIHRLASRQSDRERRDEPLPAAKIRHEKTLASVFFNSDMICKSSSENAIKEPMSMKKLPIIWTVFFLQACSPSLVDVDPAASQVVAHGTVVHVARFAGDPDYVDAATDFFVAELEQQISNTVVAGRVAAQNVHQAIMAAVKRTVADVATIAACV